MDDQMTFPLDKEHVTKHVEIFVKQTEKRIVLGMNQADTKQQFAEGKRVLYEALDDGRIDDNGFTAGMNILAAARTRFIDIKE